MSYTSPMAAIAAGGSLSDYDSSSRVEENYEFEIKAAASQGATTSLSVTNSSTSSYATVPRMSPAELVNKLVV